MRRKGIILAGGSGCRLHPVTYGVNKHLLPVYDKPMIYYPLSVLMLTGIQDILLITTPEDQDIFYRLLGDGSRFGLNLSYAVQERPEGLAQAFTIGEKFLGNDHSCLALGDNVFHGNSFIDSLMRADSLHSGATIFGCYVGDPERYGVVDFDEDFCVRSIEEKPLEPKSNYAVPGLYFYDTDVVEIAKMVQPSARGELEITSINQYYLSQGRLNILPFGRGMAWLDTGTHESLLQASHFIQTLDNRQGLKVACLEEIAFNKGWITRDQLQESIDSLQKTKYGTYLQNLLVPRRF